MEGLQIVSLGHCVPKNKVENSCFENTLDTSDEWIQSRTGIKTRRFATEETTASLALEAAREALERSGISPLSIALCIVATFSPNTLMPNMASTVASGLGLPTDAICFDLNAACTGFVYALGTAHGMLAQTPGKYALVIGSERISNLLDFTDRGTCVLFGDGAGAAVVRRSPDHPFFLTGGTLYNTEALTCERTESKIKMQGQAVFRFAVEEVPKCINAVLEKALLTTEDIDSFVCHQANKRIIESAAKRLGVPIDKFFMNLQHYGNTSAASIPLALYELGAKAGQRIVCVGFGAGLSYGGVLLTL